jgi:uncharacterized cupin superfamily protein
MREAELRTTEHGLVPDGEGWFVLNARDAPWGDAGELGLYCGFEGESRFPQLGLNLNVLQPGQAMSMYHREGDQEDFLVLSGEALLVIEDEERPLRTWDFFHCPPNVAHVIVGADDGPCVVLAVGSRKHRGEALVYPVSETARRHGAGVAEETSDPREAYAGRSIEQTAYREGSLP